MPTPMQTRRLRVLAWAISISAIECIIARSGVASGAERDPATATELFEKGRAALKREDHVTACAAFAESQRLESRVGTLLNLADCEEHIAKLADARAHWQQAVDLARAVGDPRETVARERFASLDPRVPKLKVRLAAGAPHPSVVRRDDVVLGDASLAVALPVDPGPHTVVVTAQGHADATFRLTLAEAEQRDLVVTAGRPIDAASRAPDASREAGSAPSSWNGQKTAGLAAWSAGLAGAVVGTIFALEARSSNDASKRGCDANNTCDGPGLAARKDALRDGNIATGAFIVAGAAAVLGTVFWLTAPRPVGTRASSSLPSVDAISVSF